MALSTVAKVLTLGGLDDVDAYLLFRLDSESQLQERVAAELLVAEAYVATVAATAYASANPNTVLLLGRAAEYLVLQQLVESLKSRKVEGTHWALDQEDSARFQSLVDVEYELQANKILSLFGASVTNTPTVLAGLVVGQPTEPKCTEQRLLDILYEVDPYIANSRLLRTAVP